MFEVVFKNGRKGYYVNPERLIGQCGKLKCCLNYELYAYIGVIKEFPNRETKLISTEGF